MSDAEGRNFRSTWHGNSNRTSGCSSRRWYWCAPASSWCTAPPPSSPWSSCSGPTSSCSSRRPLPLLGLVLMPVLMRIDYRNYRQPIVLWTALAMVGLALVAVLFGPRINGARRWFGIAGIGVQPSEFAKLVVVFFVAAILERRMDRIDDLRYSLVPVGDRARRRRRADHAAARSRHGADDHRHRRRDGVRGGDQLPLHRRSAAGLAARGLHRADERRLPSPPHVRLPRSVGGSARRRLPGDPVADRGRHGRAVRARTDGGRAEAVLPAVPGDRLHLRGDRRGDGAARDDARARVLLRHRVARAAHVDARARIASARSWRSA